MTERHYKWYSHNLSMDTQMLVFGDSGYPLILFPTTLGSYYECKDMKLVESARHFVEQGKVQIYCVDAINDHSWYNKKVHPSVRVKNHTWYDKMILEEVVDKVRFNTPSGKVCVAGPSFGGYMAGNFAFRYPDRVSHLLSMSGSFNIKSFLDGHYDDNVYFNNPVDFVPGMNHPDLWKMKIVLGTSEWDICKEFNFEMSKILKEKQVDHWLDIRGWVEHDWPLWREMFPHYLSLL